MDEVQMSTRHFTMFEAVRRISPAAFTSAIEAALKLIPDDYRQTASVQIGTSDDGTYDIQMTWRSPATAEEIQYHQEFMAAFEKNEAAQSTEANYSALWARSIHNAWPLMTRQAQIVSERQLLERLASRHISRKDITQITNPRILDCNPRGIFVGAGRLTTGEDDENWESAVARRMATPASARR